jgi:hypothetical protein
VPEDRVRYRAKIELSARDTKQVIAGVEAWMKSLDPKDPRYEHHMMEALWVYQWHNRVNEPLLTRMLTSARPPPPPRVLVPARSRRESPRC